MKNSILQFATIVSLTTFIIGGFFIASYTLYAQQVYDNPVSGAYIENGTAGNGQDRVKNPDGTVIAEPFADAVDIVVLEDNSALVSDGALNFIVGFGGRFGNNFQPFGNVPGAANFVEASDGNLYVTGAEDSVWLIDPDKKKVAYVCGGVPNPTDVRLDVKNTSDGGNRVHLVESGSHATYIVDTKSGNVVSEEAGPLDTVLAQVTGADTETLPVQEGQQGKEERGPWWLFVFLIPLLAGVWGISRGLREKKKFKANLPPTTQYDASKDPYGGSVDMVPKDPCEELKKKLDAAKAKATKDAEAATSADQVATDAKAAADQAAKDAEDAAQRQRDADRAVTDAEQEVRDANQEPVEGDSAQSDGYKFTSRDQKLKDKAIAGIKADYDSGKITAQEQSDRLHELNTQEGTERLREEDNKNREQRQQEAKEDLERAQQEQKEADKAKDTADQAATDTKQSSKDAAEKAANAKSTAEKSQSEADAAQEAYDKCINKTRAAWASAEAQRKKEYEESLEKQNNPDPVEEGTAEELLGGGSQPKRTCCESGVWIGVGLGGGGSFFVGGKEYAHMLWFCASDPSKYVEVIIETWRIGPALGGEGTVHVGVALAEHASQIPELLKGDADGVGWDLSLGGSAGQAAKAANAGAETSGMLKDLAKAVKAAATKDAPLSDIAKNENVAKAAKSLANSAQSTAAKTGVGAAESGGKVVKISVGPALQVGLWMGVASSVFVNSYNSCGCKVSNQ